ncbi:hypothetical protein ACFQZO_02150 [Bradyrhizobium sp. GCM10027634]|uniref:hypothetical protein n=1 Tax=unclassified Bradyrhizobium TaxID=2631580 RepID=UPI00188ABBA2|nr:MULTISPECIES: hypothetical protein [unclassified Bradyrhizobium]MDN4999687.1 hypothetical protein [Bradyrhizobium sp. WYCCWR 12677]QOZ43405.1 hypothetical protein XH89_07870 [Bradyrhizobium sp. CCBAU 53340]
MIKFAGEAAISAAVLAIVLRAEWGYVAAHGDFFGWLIILPPALLVSFLIFAAPFVAVMFYGFATARFGLALGPILSIAMTYGFHARSVAQEDEFVAQKRAIIAKLVPEKAEPLHADHTLLAVDDFNNGRLCDQACINVLATSAYTLALKSTDRRDSTWAVYEQAEGPTCLAKDNAKLALQFLLRGFPGKCATQKTIVNLGDGLLLRIVWSRNPNGQITPGMPQGFTGTMYETFERIDGQDRLLARRIEGSLESKVYRFPFWKQLPSIAVGTPIDRMSFLTNAVGTDVGPLRAPVNPFPYDEVLTGIEKYFDLKDTLDADTFHSARWSWLQIAVNAARPQTQLLKDHILRLFATRDPMRIELGLKAITDINLDERDFADEVMIELMFVPMNAEVTSLLEKQLERQFAPPRKSPTAEVREQAKARLNDPNLQSWQSRILNRIDQLP